MNSGVIIKIEFKPNTGSVYQEINMIPHTGNFSEPVEETEAGNVFSFSSGFKIAEVKPDTDTLLNSITGRRATFRITDANGKVHTVGDGSYRARFSFTRLIDGTPGSFNGYACQITRKAPTAVPTV
jgi:hypothetical protein